MLKSLVPHDGRNVSVLFCQSSRVQSARISGLLPHPSRLPALGSGEGWPEKDGVTTKTTLPISPYSPCLYPSFHLGPAARQTQAQVASVVRVHQLLPCDLNDDYGAFVDPRVQRILAQSTSRTITDFRVLFDIRVRFSVRSAISECRRVARIRCTC
jgi:hypothetical protein